MYKRQTVVVNQTGIHARPASEFVNEAKKYENCEIMVYNLDTPEREPVSAKRIFAVLSLGMGTGAHVEISAEGKKEEDAVNALIALIDSGFGE